MAVRIVTDSACDLPLSLVQALGITIVPLHVTLDGQDVSDTYACPDRFWEQVERHGGRPTTAAPAPGTITEMLRPLVEAGDEVVALTLTSKLSAVFQTFVVSAREFPGRVHVFDTWSLSLGQGVQVWAAARLAAAGVRREEILAYLRDLRSRVRLRAVLDTVEWAERGGRIAYLMPLIRRSARMFNVKALLHVVEGRVHLLGLARGYRRALEMLKARTRDSAPVEHLLVPHTRRADLAATLAKEMVAELEVPGDNVLVHEAGPILAAHVGPGAIGVVVTEAR